MLSAAAFLPLPFVAADRRFADPRRASSNPLYSLLIAYTNDFLDQDDMAGGLGRADLHQRAGRDLRPAHHRLDDGRWSGRGGFFLYIAVLMAALAAYAAWRMTQRAAPAVADTGAFAPITPTASPLAVEAALEHIQDEADAQAEADAKPTPRATRGRPAG